MCIRDSLHILNSIHPSVINNVFDYIFKYTASVSRRIRSVSYTHLDVYKRQRNKFEKSHGGPHTGNHLIKHILVLVLVKSSLTYILHTVCRHNYLKIALNVHANAFPILHSMLCTFLWQSKFPNNHSKQNLILDIMLNECYRTI